jgi:hypothetical protein
VNHSSSSMYRWMLVEQCGSSTRFASPTAGWPADVRHTSNLQVG